MPTSLMLKCQDILLPVITSLINLSLETGQFPDVWKEAIGYSLLKDVDCGSTLTNLCLISNLSYISKLTEKAVFQQLNKYLPTHELYPKLQSAYRKHHSTESNQLYSRNSQHVSLLVLLDLSAAFDTIDHSLLIDRLKYKLGVNGTVLAWFFSYLTNRKQRIHINGSISEIFALNYGVSQGSCLGPLLFIIYASEMFSVIESHPPSSHGYADDTQLCCSINPYCADAQVVAVQDMENCISDVRDWTAASKLKMNDDKTECMLIGTRQQLAKLSLDKITVGKNSISLSQNVKNLGTLMDCNLKFHKQINNLCKSSYYFLYNIRKIRKYLTKDLTATLVHALVISRLDYCNSILYGLPAYQIAKLQSPRHCCKISLYDS